MINESLKRSIISIALAVIICIGAIATTPITTQAADENDYVKAFDFYVYSAAKGELIPSLSGNLDEFMSESDLLDFLFQFMKVKCGIDVDSALDRARS